MVRCRRRHPGAALHRGGAHGRLGLDEDLVTGGLAASPLSGLLQRVLTTTAHFPVEHAAKDVRLATAAADLPLARTVLDVFTAHPGPPDADLARIAGPGPSGAV